MRRSPVLPACALVLLLGAPGGPAAHPSVAAASIAPALHQHASPAVDRLLPLVADYLARYERGLTSVVAEEDYTQRLGAGRGVPSRHLRSDLLFVFVEPLGYMGFRDVFAVDGAPVRDREERLATLFLNPRGNPVQRARRIAEESARYNLNFNWVRIERTINMPFTALKFLRGANQPRSVFRLDERLHTQATTPGDVAIAFNEKARPPLIESPDSLPASGVVWLDPASGRISRTELAVRTGSTSIRIRVAYAPDETLGLWLPSSMEEEYRISGGGRIEGSARYANFRRFTVDTATELDTP